MLSDWSSIFQLACAYTIIVGGYSNIKSKNERDAEEMLTRAQSTLSKILKNSPPDDRDLDDQRKIEFFEYIDWNSTSLRQLNKHRRKLTKWYYDTKDRRNLLDVYRQIALLCIGLIAFSLLIASAALPDLAITLPVGLAISAALWIPTFGIMGWTWFEGFQIGQQIRRSQRPKSGEEPSPSRKPFPGMIYAVTNSIERLARSGRD